MTERDTAPILPVDPTASPQPEVTFWRRRTLPPMLGDRWKSLTGPWGRFYAGIAVGLAFVWQPRTWPALAALALVVLVGSFGRRHWLWYAIPLAAVGVGTGSGEWMAAAAGLIIFGHRWANRASRPDALAMRLHLRIAELTGSPTKERYWRLETWAEQRDRLLTFLRAGKAGGKTLNPFKKIRKEEWRPVNPVPHWLRIDPAPPQAVAHGAYPIAGLYIHYPASCPDDDPAWQQRLLQAAAAKLPPMPVPGTEDTAPPALIGAWQTDQDYVNVTVARPMPARVTLADLPESPWEDTVVVGLTSPDDPVATMIDGQAAVLWNLFNDYDPDCPVAPEPNGIFIGPPGSGKTNTGRTAIHQVREYLRAMVWAIDGKEEGAFAYLEGQEGCRETSDPAQAKKFILEAHQEMRNRYAVNDRARRNNEPLTWFRPIVLPIDEGMSWLDQIASDPDINEVVAKLVDLARKDRGARMSILWLTQRADVQGVQGKGTVGQMRDSLGFKLAGAGTSETGARMIYGDSNGALAQRIPKKPLGRMGLMVGQHSDHFGIVQIALTPDPKAKTRDADGFRRHADRAYLPQPEDTSPDDDTPPVASITSRRRTMTP